MSDTISFVVMDPTIPDNGSFTLDNSIEDLLLVSKSSRNGAVRDISHFDDDRILHQMVREIEKS
jgi:hypothetical protein